MGVLDPIHLVGRRHGEYPLIQDTISRPLNRSSSWVRSLVLPNRSSSLVVVLKTSSTNLPIFDLEDHRGESEEFTHRVSEEPFLSSRPLSMPCYFYATPRVQSFSCVAVSSC